MLKTETKKFLKNFYVDPPALRVSDIGRGDSGGYVGEGVPIWEGTWGFSHYGTCP